MANPADIVDIINVPALIKDDFIKAGKVVMNGKGNPIHYTGGFAVVFPFVVNHDKWAFRCWYNSVGNIGKRLQTLSDELNRINLPYFCKFHYSDRGIVIDGTIKPTTRMLWVDGDNIKDYICKHSNNPQKLIELGESFMRMCKDLHKANIAHGDLQHGNIIVDRRGQIFLIDYDSVYVPALKGEKDIITGLAAYQHPSRIRGKNIYAHEKLDYFSELVIYLSIIAISESPDLVEKFNVRDGDNLIFTREDFVNLKSSNVYHHLRRLSGDVNNLLDILEEYLQFNSIEKLSPFETMFSAGQIANYCINCGLEFENKDDLFCIRCGVRRS